MWRDLGARSHRALGRNRGLIWERSAGAAARADVAFPVAARSGTPHAPVSHVAIRAVTGTRRDGTEFIFSHTLTSCGACVCSCITLSHLRTQIRWAASEIRICSSLSVLLFFFGLSLLLFPSWASSLVTRQLLPSIIPRLISGHLSRLCGHISLARSHTSFAGPASHTVSICSIDSWVLHLVHFPLSS